MVLVWEPITDLPENWRELTDGELGPLLQFWNDQRGDIEQSGALAEFSKRLAREWAIETGQIEGVYELDRGITQTLIERGIDADLIGNHPGQKPPELIAAIIQDHADVLEGLFQFVKGDRPLTRGYIHELHASLLRHQETTVVMDQFGQFFETRLAKGKYKERPNNPKKPDGSMHQYCPPEQVDSEMERLLSWHGEHLKKGVPVEIEAAWLHHRFTQIHPYQDGNGRVARALATLIFVKAGWFPVVVTRDDRSRYIDDLEAADAGGLKPFVSFLVDVQKRALFQATQTVADLQRGDSVEEAIAAAKRVLTGAVKGLDPRVWSIVKTTADRLLEIADHRIYNIAQSLQKEIGHATQKYAFSSDSRHSPPVTVFNPLAMFSPPYPTNPSIYEQERSLKILGSRMMEEQALYITIQARAVGSKSRGMIAVVGLFKQNGSAEMISPDIFQINYAEHYESAEARFRPWLEEALVNGLTMWRKTL